MNKPLIVTGLPIQRLRNFARNFTKAKYCEEGIGCDKCKSCLDFNSNHSFSISELNAKIYNTPEFIEQIKEIASVNQVSPTFIIEGVKFLTKEAKELLLDFMKDYKNFIFIGEEEVPNEFLTKGKIINIK